MLEGWHIGPGALKDRCQSITLPFDLCSSARDGFTNIYAQGTEETWKEKEGVEVLAGGSKVVFWGFFIGFFSSESVECKKSNSEVMQVRHKSDKQE